MDAVLRSNLKIVDLDPTTPIEAAKLRCRYRGLPMADAIVAIRSPPDLILADDTHIRQVGEVKTVDVRYTV